MAYTDAQKEMLTRDMVTFYNGIGCMTVSAFGVVLGEGTKRVKRSMGVSGGDSLQSMVHADLSDSASKARECVALFGAAAEALLVKYKKDIVRKCVRRHYLLVKCKKDIVRKCVTSIFC